VTGGQLPLTRTASIAALFVALLIPVVTIVLAGFGAFDYVTESRREWVDLRVKAIRLGDELSVGLALPVWNFDHDQIQSVLSSAMSGDEEVYGLAVKLADRNATLHAMVRDGRWKATPAAREFSGVGLITEKRQIMASGEVVGTVTVFVSPRFARARMRDSLLYTMSTIVVLDLVLVLGVVLLVWRLVIRPIRRVERYAVAVSTGARDTAFIRGQSFHGEIEKLRGAMERMVGMLDRRYDELQESKSELARYRDTLEELVLQRKRQLEQATAELVHAERMAALGQVAATVGHELRNPLGTVKNALFSVGESLDGAQAARVRRSLELAERNVQRCDRIISELLEYAKKRAPRIEPTTLDTWLSGVLDECTVPGSIELHRALDSGVVLSVDREILRRAVENVVTNSVQAMGEEGAAGTRMDVETHVRAQRAEIVVTDRGSGITDEVLERMWEPMYSTKPFGVGLGMSIVRSAMEDHGGGVEVQSRPGTGTTITLWLPLPPG
jgi:signal transduction histidine kinase